MLCEVRAVVKEFQKRMGKEIESIPRELRNVIEHAVIVSKGKTLDVHVSKRATSETDVTGNLDEMERRHIVAVLEKSGWRIAGQGDALKVLGLKRTTLQAKMKKFDINRFSKPMPK
jgi:formate hydrogenlyase transcriptional activator